MAASASAAVEHLPADIKAALEQPSAFTTTNRLDAIPASVRKEFVRATGLDTFRMAKPGERWQATDVIIDRSLPGRRLQWVAVSRDVVVLFYEKGGIGQSYQVCVFRLAADTARLAWHGALLQEAPDVEALVRAIRADAVDDDPRLYL